MWLEEEKSESKGMGRLSQSLVGHDEDSGSCINRARGTGVASSDLCIEGISVVTQVRTDKRGQRQSRRRSWKATVLIQVRDNDGPNWMVARGEKWSDSGYFEGRPTGFADGLDEKYERKTGIKNDSKVFILSN